MAADKFRGLKKEKEKEEEEEEEEEENVHLLTHAATLVGMGKNQTIPSIYKKKCSKQFGQVWNPPPSRQCPNLNSFFMCVLLNTPSPSS